jgi:hypothetical protein
LLEKLVLKFTTVGNMLLLIYSSYPVSYYYYSNLRQKKRQRQEDINLSGLIKSLLGELVGAKER